MTTDDIIKMAKEYADEVTNGYGVVTYEFDLYGLEKFALLIRAVEREACAKLLDDLAAKDKLSNYYKVAALAIRERGAP